MPYKAHITKVDTGETRTTDIEWDWHKNGEDGDWFWWSEGNYSCDCNRELCFLRAGGETPEISDVECSEGKYTVEIELPDGKRIPIKADE